MTIYFSLSSATPGSVCTRNVSHTGRIWHGKFASVTHLALEELETGTSTSADVAQLVLRAVLRRNSGGITTANDDCRAILCSLNRRVKECFGALSELGKLEDTRRTVGSGMSTVNGNLLNVTDPFQRMVLDSRTVARKSSRLLGPASRPIQSLGIPSESVTTPVCTFSISWCLTSTC